MDNKKVVIESLLTGSQFEIGISGDDKILKIKNQIQKTLGKLKRFFQHHYYYNILETHFR